MVRLWLRTEVESHLAAGLHCCKDYMNALSIVIHHNYQEANDVAYVWLTLLVFLLLLIFGWMRVL